MTTLAVDALGAAPDVYQRGNRLVHVVRDVARARGFRRPIGSPRIVELPLPRLRELLTRHAEWGKLRVTQKDGKEFVPAHPPEWAITQVAARGDWPKVRSLEAVVETPILRPDGTVLETPGYDDATGLLYEPNTAYPEIPPAPTREDARWAAEALLAIVADFPMVEVQIGGQGDGGAVHRAAWLAALLTVLVRFAIAGTCPLFLFDANTPGAGKTLLCDLIAWIITGRNMPRTDYPDTNEELGKSVLAVALAGDLLMLFDNVATTFGGPALDSTLTAPTIKGRILGKSEMSGELPMNTVWFATGNNMQLRGDVLRRVVNCRLEPKEERPEERDPQDFAIKEPLSDYVAQRRGQLVVQALTIVRAYVLAGCPKPQPALTAIDFRGWSELVRSSIHWAIGVDPCAGRKDLAATDADTSERTALVEGWAGLPGGDTGLTVAEALDLLKTEPSAHGVLRNVMLEWSRSGDLPSARAVGKRLTAIRGRVVGGKAFTSRPYQGTQRWSVRAVDPGGSCGNGGSI